MLLAVMTLLFFADVSTATRVTINERQDKIWLGDGFGDNPNNYPLEWTSDEFDLPGLDSDWSVEDLNNYLLIQ